MNKFLASTLTVAVLLLMVSPAPAELYKETDGIFHALIDATMANNYDGFVSVCDDTMKAALTKTQLAAVSQQIAPRAKGGYDTAYLGELSQHGFAVHLWRLRFKDGGDDVLVTLSVKDHKAGGFYLK